MQTALICGLVLSLIGNLILLIPFLLRTLLAVPAPDRGSWGFISTNPRFTNVTIHAMARVGDVPLCTAHSATSSGLRRFLFADGRLFNTDDNLAFIEELGGATAFFARVSKDPKTDAENLARGYNEWNFKATVVEHYDPDMKGKMYFVSFKGSTYNPGWVPAFRLCGRKLGATKRCSK